MSTKKPLYMWTGSEWILVGDGGGLSPQAASAIYLSQSNASVIYATKEELANIDLSLYLTSSNASSIYLSITNASSTYLPKSGGSINGSLIIDGDLTVSGSTTYLNTTELNIEDNLITLNYGISGSPSISAGIEVERGTSPNVSIQWNESNDRWEFTKDGSTYKELGSGAVLYQSASPDAAALGLEVGSVWIDSDGVVEDAVGVNHIHGQYLSTESASSIYLSKNSASSTYLPIVNASAIYATKAELQAFSSEEFFIKAESYTASNNDGVFVNTASGLYTITLPSPATLGNKVTIIDLANNAENNNITVNPNGLKIDGASSNFVIDINNAAIEFIYSNNTYGWRSRNG
jgi:hypothetical protein